MWTALDKAAKTLLNKRATSVDKKPYEEFGDNTLDVSASEVKAQSIPLNDPAQGIVDGTVQEYTNFNLTKDNTVANSQAWYAFQSGNRLKNWISDKYGAAYAIKLYDSLGNQIFPTDASDWIFDYVTGILTFNGTVSVNQPLRITGYRYIGAYMDTFSAGGKLKKHIIPITSDGQTTFDLSVDLPEPFSEIFQVKVNGIPLKSTEWTVLAETLTFVELVAQFELETSDEFEVQYYAS